MSNPLRRVSTWTDRHQGFDDKSCVEVDSVKCTNTS